MISNLRFSVSGKSAKVVLAVTVMLAIVVGVGFSTIHSSNNAGASSQAKPMTMSLVPGSRAIASGSIDLSKAPTIKAGAQKSAVPAVVNRRLPAAARAKVVGLNRGVPAGTSAANSPKTFSPNFVGGTLGGVVPLLGVHGEGLNSNQSCNCQPPDQAIAVGGGNSLNTNYVVEGVNNAVAIYNDNLTMLAGPYSADTIFGSVKIAGDFFSDPQITYDATRVHWVITWLEITPSASTASGVAADYIDMAVSKNINPTGVPTNYYVYRFPAGANVTNGWCDYPTLGMSYWSFYVTCIMFDTAGNFQGNRLFDFSKSLIYAGAAGSSIFWGYWNGSLPTTLSCGSGCLAPAYRVAPAIEDGAPSAEWIVGTDAGYLSSSTSSGVTLSAVTNDFALNSGNYAGVTLTILTGALPLVYGDPVAAQQSGTTNLIDSGIGIKQFMYKGGRLWFAFTTDISYNGDTATRDAVYWAAIEPYLTPQSAHNPQWIAGWSNLQAGYFGYSGRYTYMPSIMGSDEGDAAMVFNYSGSSIPAGIVYTGRMANDTLGTMGQGNSVFVVGGNGAYGGSRWGDYSACSLNIQPTERAQLYCAGEYAGSITSGSSAAWNTYIYALRMQ